jgi:hypothetical protein
MKDPEQQEFEHPAESKQSEPEQLLSFDAWFATLPTMRAHHKAGMVALMPSGATRVPRTASRWRALTRSYFWI